MSVASSLEYICPHEGVLIADDVLLALMLLVGHWHENRENSSDVSKAPVPFGFSSLLEPYRFIPL